MAYNNNVITAPVSINDVKQVLNANSYDLGTLCIESSINMWAKKKPEGVASGLQSMPVAILTDAMRQLNGYGIRTLYQNGYGSLSSLVTALRNNSVRSMFEYIKPSGGINSPYRLTDFNGYYHGAQPPIWSPYNSGDTLRVNGDGTLQLYYYTNVNGSDMELGLKDLRFSQDANTFANYYFGILIWDDSTRYFGATQDHKMGSSWQEGLDVTLKGVTQDNHTYKMIPFFSTLPIDKETDSFSGTIFPMEFAKTEIKTGSAADLVSISTWVFAWSNDLSKIRLKWAVENYRSAAFNLIISSSNSYVTVGTPSQQGTYGYWGVNVNESIPAESSRQGEVIIASNLLVAQQDFIRNGDSFVTITANRPNAPYQYTGIVQMWDPE